MARDKKTLTTSFGMPVDSDQDTMTVGPRGPVLLQDVHLIEKLAHFSTASAYPSGWYTQRGPAQADISRLRRMSPDTPRPSSCPRWVSAPRFSYGSPPLGAKKARPIPNGTHEDSL